MSGRRYKNDLSDVAGILLEHQKNGTPIVYEDVDKAVNKLYRNWDGISKVAIELCEEIFKSGDYEAFYIQNREGEIWAKGVLTDFNKTYPGELKGENIDTILEQARKKMLK